MRLCLRRCGVGLAFCGAAGGALAAPITVTNHSFEAPVIAPNTFNVNSPGPTGWQAYGTINFGGRSIGVLNPTTTNFYLDPVPDGSNVGVVFLMDNASNQSQFNNSEAGMRQTLATNLANNTQYTLTVEVGNLANGPQTDFQFNGFPNYRVDLMAGATVLASDNNTLLPGEGRFLTSTTSFTTGAAHALAGQALTIRLVNLNSAVGIEVNFDNVRLDATPVPEPTAAGVVGIALVGMLARRTKRRNDAAVA